MCYVCRLHCNTPTRASTMTHTIPDTQKEIDNIYDELKVKDGESKGRKNNVTDIKKRLDEVVCCDMNAGVWW